LPPNFKAWDLPNVRGWTVAHQAAERGDLPPGFEGWDMADEDGVTVRDIYEIWRKKNA
jgi:hypothetical protein